MEVKHKKTTALDSEAQAFRIVCLESQIENTCQMVMKSEVATFKREADR